MKHTIRLSSIAVLMLTSAAFAQVGGGNNGINGTGDAAARNLPSTVGIGRQSGGNYYSGTGGGEQPFYSGRSASRRAYAPYYGDGDAYSGTSPYGYPRVRGYGYGFGRYPY